MSAPECGETVDELYPPDVPTIPDVNAVLASIQEMKKVLDRQLATDEISLDITVSGVPLSTVVRLAALTQGYLNPAIEGEYVRLILTHKEGRTVFTVRSRSVQDVMASQDDNATYAPNSGT